MKKLKVYKKVDFHFVEVCLEGAPIADTNHPEYKDNTPLEGGSSDGEQEDAWAPVFRGGIWDED